MLEPHRNRRRREEGGRRAGLHAAIVYVGKDSHEKHFQDCLTAGAC